MKYFIASDIHGSAYYAQQMLEAFHAEKADKLLLLGDILYHGPRNDLPKDYNPKAVIALLNPLKDRIFCVRGNCEAEVDQMVLDFPVLADYALFVDSGVSVFATHGHLYNENNVPPFSEGTVLLHGHTHIPVCRQHDATDQHGAYTYVNPGSVSIPKEGSHHGYMIWEGSTFTWKDLSGQVIQTVTI